MSEKHHIVSSSSISRLIWCELFSGTNLRCLLSAWADSLSGPNFLRSDCPTDWYNLLLLFLQFFHLVYKVSSLLLACSSIQDVLAASSCGQMDRTSVDYISSTRLTRQDN